MTIRKRIDHQEIRHSLSEGSPGVDAHPMGLTHCPICVGLAVLSASRFMAHVLMASQLIRPRPAEMVNHQNVVRI